MLNTTNSGSGELLQAVMWVTILRSEYNIECLERAITQWAVKIIQ